MKRQTKEQVLQRIKEFGEKILPQRASLWIHGPRARGDARPDSDYDLLILLDKVTLSLNDYLTQKPLREMGYGSGDQPTSLRKKEWQNYYYTPFHDNVSRGKTCFGMSLNEGINHFLYSGQ